MDYDRDVRRRRRIPSNKKKKGAKYEKRKTNSSRDNYRAADHQLSFDDPAAAENEPLSELIVRAVVSGAGVSLVLFRRRRVRNEPGGSPWETRRREDISQRTMRADARVR